MRAITFFLILASVQLYGQWTNSPQVPNAIVTGTNEQYVRSEQTQEKHSAVVDANNNIITAFVDYTVSWQNIFVQKINANGEKLWGNSGINIYTGEYIFEGGSLFTGLHQMQIVPDGQGGAIIAFVGSDSNERWSTLFSPRSIMAIRIDANGNHVWGGRVFVSDTSLINGNAEEFHMISDGNGGAYFGWMSRLFTTIGANSNFKLFYQHLNANGSREFGDDVLLKSLNFIGTYSSGYNYYPTLESSPDGNIFIAWKDTNPGTNNLGLFCLKINPQGDTLWPDVLVDTGITTFGPNISNLFPHKIAVTADGCFLFYRTGHDQNSILRLSYISNNGTALFSNMVISDYLSSYSSVYHYEITTTPNGDAILLYNHNGFPWIQKVNNIGQKLFGVNGINISSSGCNSNSGDRNYLIRTTDNKFLAVYHSSNGSIYRLTAKLFDENANFIFPNGGIILFHGTVNYANLLKTNDSGGVIIGSTDVGNGNNDDVFAFKVNTTNNPIEIYLYNGSNHTLMATTDNLTFTIDDYALTGNSGSLRFSKYNLASYYLPTMPAGIGTCNVTTSNALGAGTYNVTYNAMTREYSFENTLGVSANMQSNWTTFPNPVSSFLNFSESLKQFEIFTIDGKKIMEGTDERIIDVSSFPSGIYILKGQSPEENKVASKFLKS